MSQDLFEHDFEVDLTEKENAYVVDDVQWTYINDINAMNYATGYVNWTNIAVVGSSVNKQYSWANAYVSIPYQVAILPDGGTNGLAMVISPANVNAMSVKNYLNFVDWQTIKFNGVQCNGSYCYNLYSNEKVKQMNVDQYKLISNMIGHAFDTENSLSLLAGVGEVNNNIVTPATALGYRPQSTVNKGHLERCKTTNTDLTSNVNCTATNFYGANLGLRDNEFQGGIVYQGTDGILFQGFANIPLALLHPFFAEMPSVASSTGFELRLQLNIARENSWQVNYDNNLNAIGMNINQVIGNTCPFLLSQPSTDGSTGLRVSQKGAFAGGSLTIKSQIGWGAMSGGNATGIYAQQASAPACRIVIPAISFTSEYVKKIIAHPQYTLKYNDYYVDHDEGKKQGDTVSRLFNVQLSKVRKLYIIPFLSAKQAVGNPLGVATLPCPAYNSPLSSAPTTYNLFTM